VQARSMRASASSNAWSSPNQGSGGSPCRRADWWGRSCRGAGASSQARAVRALGGWHGQRRGRGRQRRRRWRAAREPGAEGSANPRAAEPQPRADHGLTAVLAEVLAEVTLCAPASGLTSRSARATTAAIGDRQMLPWHTMMRRRSMGLLAASGMCCPVQLLATSSVVTARCGAPRPCRARGAPGSTGCSPRGNAARSAPTTRLGSVGGGPDST